MALAIRLKIKRLRVQKLVRFAARVVPGRKRFDRVSDALTDRGQLHTESTYRCYLVLTSKLLATSESQHFAASLAPRKNVLGRDTRNSGMLVIPALRSESKKRYFL